MRPYHKKKPPQKPASRMAQVQAPVPPKKKKRQDKNTVHLQLTIMVYPL
jgi:hypothetical protein